MHGPPSSYADTYGQIVWGPTISVLDTVVLTLGDRNRRRWRRLRKEALAKWAPAGLTFTVSAGDPDDYPTFDPSEPDEYRRLTDVVVMDTLRIMDLQGLPNFDKYGGATVCGWGAWAALDMSQFWRLTQQQREYGMVHEIGHCFGLAHRQDTDGTCMWQGLYPDEHDLLAVKAFHALA